MDFKSKKHYNCNTQIICSGDSTKASLLLRLVSLRHKIFKTLRDNFRIFESLYGSRRLNMRFLASVLNIFKHSFCVIILENVNNN